MNLEVNILEREEGPALGAALLASVGCGVYPDVTTAANKLVKVVETVVPDPELVEKYEEKYHIFCKLYPPLNGEAIALF